MTPHPYGWLSLLPPVVAIALAIATRRIVFSLVSGIFAGALLMSGGHPLIAIYHTWETHLWQTLIDPGKLRVFSFTILMGAMIGVITRSGGMQGLIQLVEPYASDRRRGQFATWVMGLLIFFDDYANTILLGSTLRPVCDRLRISREKLAYLVDSTAAPVAGLAPLSTWVAVEIDYIGNGLESISSHEMTAFGLFLASIPYRFYVLGALLLVPITAWLGRDLGPMIAAEQRAIDGYRPDNSGIEPEVSEIGAARWYHAVLPIALTLSMVIYFIGDTGSRGACSAVAAYAVDAATQLVSEPTAELGVALHEVEAMAATGRVGDTQRAIRQLGVTLAGMLIVPDDLAEAYEPDIKLRDILGEADSSLALQYGALGGLVLAFLLPMISRSSSVSTLSAGALAGAKVVLPAVAILWTASAMSKMTTDKSFDGLKSSTPFEFKDHRLYTADYLTRIVSGDAEGAGSSAGPVSTKYLPTLVFVLAALVAFCTGTSWGTMGILVPMVVQTAYAMLMRDNGVVTADDPIMLCSIGGVLAGAVFGDHCSPISDTTVLSSQSSGCDHLAHVWTQMPYALLAALVSILLGTLPLGFGVSVWVLLPLQLLALFMFMRLIGRRTSNTESGAA